MRVQGGCSRVGSSRLRSINASIVSGARVEPMANSWGGQPSRIALPKLRGREVIQNASGDSPSSTMTKQPAVNVHRGQSPESPRVSVLERDVCGGVRPGGREELRSRKTVVRLLWSLNVCAKMLASRSENRVANVPVSRTCFAWARAIERRCALHSDSRVRRALRCESRMCVKSVNPTRDSNASARMSKGPRISGFHENFLVTSAGSTESPSLPLVFTPHSCPHGA